MIKLYKNTLTLSLIIILIGAIFKIQHYPGGALFLIIGITISTIYMAIGFYTLYKNKSLSIIQKICWVISFFLFSWLTGLVYYYTELRIKNN